MNSDINVYTVLPGPRRSKIKNGFPGACSTVVSSLVNVSNFKHYVIGDESNNSLDDKGEYIPIKKSILRFFRGRKKYYVTACENILSKMPPGIVEVHNRALYLLYLSEQLPQHRYCLYIHNVPQKMRGLNTPEERQKVLDKVAAVYVVSEYIKNCYLEGVIDDNKKVHVIYNAICFNQASKPVLDLPANLKDRKLIVFVGRMIQHKGGLELAKALAAVLPKYPDWAGVFIGARYFGRTKSITNYETEVYACLQSLGGQAHYMNALPREAVLMYFSCAEIAAIPSIWDEPFGLTALEAMSNHTAIISSNRGGLAEVVSDKGIIVCPEDVDQFSSAIASLIENDALREALKQKAYDHVLSNFNIDIVGKELDKIREEIVKS